MWKEYILKSGNGLTFPKKKGEIGFIFYKSGVNGRKGTIDATHYAYLNCVPFKCTKKELIKGCSMLAYRFWLKHPYDDFNGFIIRRVGKREATCVILGRENVKEHTKPKVYIEKETYGEGRLEEEI